MREVKGKPCKASALMLSRARPRQGRGGQERTVTRKERAETAGEYINGYNCHPRGAKKLSVALSNSDEGDAHSAAFRVRPAVA